ncbi:PucR family transcriptional regulator ligand-binding domain-containing protein [Saccharothrix sp. S26]|uniref:PucR family transcriptional regulator n=1 Tax=Saccharothrix sp. S26 TaxID=2907215 RepID=UPI001F342E7D|nr:PucR family transcriptional regulator [Saccharothrix sp. S26]MCE6998757.1 PucR family transcriptional regulator ligand-binding domain-containing protein [Saccharothrix sp. S26]
MLLVRSLLGMPELRLRLVVGAESLDRPLTRLYGTELPDPARYLSGGELVLSGLLWHRTAADCEKFVTSLAGAGVAALAASPPEEGELPEALVRACERRGVPLLEVPVDLSFAAITERVVLELAAERVGDAGVQLGRHRRLLTVVADGGGLAELVAAGAAELDAPCRVLSCTGRVVAGPELPDAAAFVREFLLADRLPKVVRGTTLLPVSARGGSRLTSWILVVSGDRTHDEVAAELASLVGVERARVVQGREIENRAAGPLLRQVFAGGDVAARIAAVGWDPDAPLRVLAASVSEGQAEQAVALVEEVLSSVTSTFLVTSVDAEVYALAPSGSWTEGVRSALRTLEPGLRSARVLVGISSPVGYTGLRGAAEEASHARRLGERRTGRTCVVAGEEIALHQLLLAGVPEELRRSLRRRLLGPVLDYDAEHGSDLVGTLRVFLDCSGSWTTAAARLHVHVNTLRYRVGRVEDLLGVDLSDFAERVDLYLALQAG